MSRPLVPRPSMGGAGLGGSPQGSPKPRKISTACSACKQRKTKCSGTSPCDACASRGSQCIYDASTDQRRKIANQRNMQDLQEAQQNLDRLRQLLGGVLATIRAGDEATTSDLLAVIKSGMSLSQLAAHVRNARRSSPDIEQAFARIEHYIIDGPEELPSPNQLLNSLNHHATPTNVSISAISNAHISADHVPFAEGSEMDETE